MSIFFEIKWTRIAFCSHEGRWQARQPSILPSDWSFELNDKLEIAVLETPIWRARRKLRDVDRRQTAGDAPQKNGLLRPSPRVRPVSSRRCLLTCPTRELDEITQQYCIPVRNNGLIAEANEVELNIVGGFTVRGFAVIKRRCDDALKVLLGR